MFDTEKDIAEVNILYFLYMKYKGDMKEICQILKCDTLHQVRLSNSLQKKSLSFANLVKMLNEINPTRDTTKKSSDICRVYNI